MQYIYICNVV